jgi:hypothetical protein
VTDIAVIEAIGAGTLPLAEALQGGLLRLYGPATDVAAVASWLGGPAGG